MQNISGMWMSNPPSQSIMPPQLASSSLVNNIGERLGPDRSKSLDILPTPNPRKATSGHWRQVKYKELPRIKADKPTAPKSTAPKPRQGTLKKAAAHQPAAGKPAAPLKLSLTERLLGVRLEKAKMIQSQTRPNPACSKAKGELGKENPAKADVPLSAATNPVGKLGSNVGSLAGVKANVATQFPGLVYKSKQAFPKAGAWC
jgi:hypothetical protein